MLSRLGANLNLQIISGFTCLHIAANLKNEREMLETTKTLIQRGVELDIQDFIDKTALCYATIRKNTVLVKVLIGAGANVNIGPRQEKPLWRALRYGSKKLIRALQEAGAN